MRFIDHNIRKIALLNATKKDREAITRAIQVWNNPDAYMSSKRDCHAIVQRGIEAFKKYDTC
jgi:hypothetical protein